jgi:hypothetical protein
MCRSMIRTFLFNRKSRLQPQEVLFARERSDEAQHTKRPQPSSGSRRQGECEAFVRLPLAMTEAVRAERDVLRPNNFISDAVWLPKQCSAGGVQAR